MEETTLLEKRCRFCFEECLLSVNLLIIVFIFKTKCELVDNVKHFPKYVLSLRKTNELVNCAYRNNRIITFFR